MKSSLILFLEIDFQEEKELMEKKITKRQKLGYKMLLVLVGSVAVGSHCFSPVIFCIWTFDEEVKFVDQESVYEEVSREQDYFLPFEDQETGHQNIIWKMQELI